MTHISNYIPMSQKQYLKTLHDQIHRLNVIIDRKIMLGRNYRAEARTHRALLRKLRAHRNPGFFDTLSSLFHREYA